VKRSETSSLASGGCRLPSRRPRRPPPSAPRPPASSARSRCRRLAVSHLSPPLPAPTRPLPPPPRGRLFVSPPLPPPARPRPTPPPRRHRSVGRSHRVRHRVPHPTRLRSASAAPSRVEPRHISPHSPVAAVFRPLACRHEPPLRARMAALKYPPIPLRVSSHPERASERATDHPRPRALADISRRRTGNY